MSVRRGAMLVATNQHVGKTTCCLGLVHALRNNLPAVSYMKPVGHSTVRVRDDCGSEVVVDKDVPLFKDMFHLDAAYPDMSPVIIDNRMTRDSVDGKRSPTEFLPKVKAAWENVSNGSFTVVEGTGHVGVGSIFDLNNAQVASALDLPVIIVARGGLGLSFDEVALNRALLKEHGARIAGVIVNKVEPDKVDMIKDYYGRAMEKLWGLPLLGCIPFHQTLSEPSMAQLQSLLKADVLAGERNLSRHFKSTRLAVASLHESGGVFLPSPNQLVVTHASRFEVIGAFTLNHAAALNRQPSSDLGGGLVLTGRQPPNQSTLRVLDELGIPTLFSFSPETPRGLSSYDVINKILAFTAKLDRGDERRLTMAMEHIQSHLDMDKILKIQ